MTFYYMEEHVDEGGQIWLVQYSRKGKEFVESPFLPYCYVQGKDDLGYRDARTHKPVKKREFRSLQALEQMVFSGNVTYEADVSFVHRVMLDMDWKISDVPKVWLDIETDDSHGAPDARNDPITAIGMIFDDGREVFLTTIGKQNYDEEDMLKEFMELVENVGCIITFNGGEDVWETRSFDIPYLATRYGIVVEGMESDAEGLKFAFDKKMRHCAFMDIYQIYKYETARIGKSIAGGFSLDNISQKELGKSKIKHTKKFSEMTQEEMHEYNMRDVQLLKEIDEKFSFTDLKIGLAQLTHVCLTAWKKNKKRKELSPLIMVDQLILEYSKQQKLVWATNRYDKNNESFTGARVLEPKVGIHKNIQNFDVKQMYPSIMINERLSPDKDRSIVPTILVKLKEMRKVLKKRYEETGSKEDYITQYNYKVLANIFYGAFGNPACRFYDKVIAQAITNRGRNILDRIQELCDGLGFTVVYGDTDSVFVTIAKDKVPILEKMINDTLKPYEVESGEFYKAILYLGDEHGGTKKRYAGLQEDGTMKIVGLEAIKRDYCVLSRETQIWALERLLHDPNVELIQKELKHLYKGLCSGVYDEYLVITKSAKKIEDYADKTKSGKVSRGLPHIRALKMAHEKGYKQMFDISFVYTKDDVEPVLEGLPFPTRIDYDHYFDRQIMSVVNPLIKAVQIQNGTYREPRGKKKVTVNQSLFDHMSS